MVYVCLGGCFAKTVAASGYSVIVLTVDTPYFGRRLTEIRNKFKVPPHLRMANFPESLGVKTGSQHRTEALTSNGIGDPTAISKTEKSVPANKNGNEPLLEP